MYPPDWYFSTFFKLLHIIERERTCHCYDHIQNHHRILSPFFKSKSCDLFVTFLLFTAWLHVQNEAWFLHLAPIHGQSHFHLSQNRCSISILTGMYRTLNCNIVGVEHAPVIKHSAHKISPPIFVPISNRYVPNQLVFVSSGTETPPMVDLHAQIVPMTVIAYYFSFDHPAYLWSNDSLSESFYSNLQTIKSESFQKSSNLFALHASRNRLKDVTIIILSNTKASLHLQVFLLYLW